MAALVDALKSDPEVAPLLSRIERGRKQLADLSARTRSITDPARVAAVRRLRLLEEELRALVESRRGTGLLPHRRTSIRPVSDPRAANDPDEAMRQLDAILGELEGLKRVLLRDSQKP
jgi:hypothetical protein